VVTARNTDIGSLIDAGANTTGRELFHMVAIHTLRVFVAIPEIYSRAARTGASTTLTLDEFPGRVFHGTLVRNANAIDLTSRTLLVEVDVDNPSGELLPGAYAFVHEQEALQQRRAVDSAQLSLQLFTNRYKGGADSYLQVTTAQTIVLTNQRNDIDILRRRMNASVLLVKALGGGWDAADLPKP
jgi:multidrug efflux pump subunit AcrA (membrane-fusion protein)